jgi:hypothetical protein
VLEPENAPWLEVENHVLTEVAEHGTHGMKDVPRLSLSPET